jgi:hypothetical protein
MTRLVGKRLATMVVALVVTLFGLSLPARADLTLTLTDSLTGTTGTIFASPAPTGTWSGTGPSTIIVTSTTANAMSILYLPSGGFGNFSAVSVTVDSSSPGTGPLGSQLQDIQIDTTAATGFSGVDTLTLSVSSTGFTNPSPGSGTLTSSLASSEMTGAGSTATFSSSLSDGASGSTTPISLTGPALNQSIGNSAAATITSSFTLSNLLLVSLAAGQTAQVTGTSIVSAVPEPATIMTALIGVGLPLVGRAFRFGRQRRRVQA